MSKHSKKMYVAEINNILSVLKNFKSNYTLVVYGWQILRYALKMCVRYTQNALKH